jgi:TonB-dependent receptor
MNHGALAWTRRMAAPVVCSALWLAPVAGLAAERVFRIPSRPMGEALNEFARQAGVQIFFPGEAIAGRRAPAVRGVMDSRAALDRLIAGAGLAVAEDDGRTIILRSARNDRRITARRAPAPARIQPGRSDADAATALEEVIVTGGPRAGDLKRASDTVVDTITQLEIQRLPNLDLSDVLARLPGVRRNETQSGENRYVQIRGLNNAAASQSIDGVLLTNYVNASHATSTELLPAYFTKSITVTTTVTPDLDENANSAHVALTTISGLDNGGQRIADLRGLVGDNNRSDGLRNTRRPVRLVGAWKGALDDRGRLGLAIGASLDRLGSRQDAVSVTGFSRIDGALVPNGALTRGETYTRTQRISAMGRLDARPSERLSLFAEYFFMRHDFTTEQRTAAVSVAAADVRNVSASSGQFGAAAVSYGFNRSHPQMTDHIVQLGGDYGLATGDALSFRLGVTFNRVSARSISTSGFALASNPLRTPVGYAFGPDGLDFRPGENALTSDPANYHLAGKLTVGDTLSRDQNYFARIDYDHNITPTDLGAGVKLGVQLKTQDRSNLQRGYARVPLAGAIALSDVTPATALTMFQPIDWNIDAVLDLLRKRGTSAPDTNGVYAADPADGYGQNFNGSETIAVGYGVVSYGWSRARLSAGARAAHTRREVDQYEPDAVGRYVQRRYEQNYWHVLPSAYGSYDLTERLKLRGAFTKTLERPALYSAARRLITSYDTPVTRSISYSNPYLMPTRSTNFDASVEYYYGGGAYVALGAFAKNLRDIPAVSSSLWVAPDGSREITIYTSNVREVGGKKVYGRVRGAEAAWSDPKLPGLPDQFGNLGLILSYVYLDYRFTVLNGGGVAPSDTRLVPAAPRHFRNATLAYNRGRLAANLSVQDMSSAPAFTYDRANDRRTKYEPLVDFQTSWQADDRLRILVEGRNLLDQDTTDRASASDYRPAYQIKNNGRTIWFGIQMTLF